MKIVFSYGGSILAPEDPDPGFIGEVAEMLVEISKDHRIIVVVGGGVPARKAIEGAKQGGVKSHAQLDWVGIKHTRINAQALIDALGEAAQQEIPENIMDAGQHLGGKILVMGGTEPGHSTDAVAALVADWIEADLIINASNIEYVYNKNPKIFDDATPLEQLSPKELIDMVVHLQSGAGEYALIDLVAAKIVQRAKIRMVVCDGRDLENIKKVVVGREFAGTTIE